MTLAEDVRVQFQRVEEHRLATADRELARAQRDVATAADAARTRLARLAELRRLPASVSGLDREALMPVEQASAPVLGYWTRIRENVTTAKVFELQDRITELRRVVDAKIAAAESKGRDRVQCLEEQQELGERLAISLEIDDRDLTDLMQRTRTILRQCRGILDGTSQQLNTNAARTIDEFIEIASTRALLQRGSVSERLASVVSALLNQPSMTLESISLEDLMALRQSPRLAELVRVSIPRESRSASTDERHEASLDRQMSSRRRYG